VLGFCAAMAALYPGLSSIWTTRPERAVRLISDHEGAWDFANRMFAVGIGGTLAGLAVLARVLDRASPGSALPAVGTAPVVPRPSGDLDSSRGGNVLLEAHFPASKSWRVLCVSG
jgi:hypothetical protein